MKRIILTALLAALPFAAQAEQPKAAELCPDIESFASTVMSTRQSGASMSDMMAAANGNEMLQKIVSKAFETPRFTTESVSRRATEDFANKIAAECYRELD